MLEKQLDELLQALKDARQSQTQRDALYRQWRQVGREQDEVAKNAKQLRESRARMPRKYRISDTKQLHAPSSAESRQTSCNNNATRACSIWRVDWVHA